jgi:hypothetical protein
MRGEARLLWAWCGSVLPLRSADAVVLVGRSVSGLHDAADELNGRGVSGGHRCIHHLPDMFRGSERHQTCGRHDEWILHELVPDYQY